MKEGNFLPHAFFSGGGCNLEKKLLSETIESIGTRELREEKEIKN